MKTIALLGLALLATPALAQTKADSKKSKYDPNKMICRSEESTGSRISPQKRCLTAQQWADQRLLDRQALERTQNGRYKNN